MNHNWTVTGILFKLCQTPKQHTYLAAQSNLSLVLQNELSQIIRFQICQASLIDSSCSATAKDELCPVSWTGNKVCISWV